MFIKFYGIDPIDMSWERFENLYENIGKVQYEFAPKTPEQIMLMNKQAQIEQYMRERQNGLS